MADFLEEGFLLMKKIKNKIIYLLDSSYSMFTLRSRALSVFNKILKSNIEENNKFQQSTKITVVKFDDPDSLKYIYRNINSNNVKPLTNYDYNPLGGSTALYDAVGQVINYEMSNDDDNECSFLLIVITDGRENSSKKYNQEKLSKLIKKANGTDRWTITFQVPKGYKNYLNGLGLLPGNINEWDVDEEGLDFVCSTTSAGLKGYYKHRSLGTLSIPSFYVQTDLTDLTQRTLSRELYDVSDKYGIFTASKEEQIRNFVELKTRRPYRKGIAYYQLIKNELVQSDKEILVFDKNTTKLYGGEEARSLIGLPANVNTKVIPGNHANFEIFIKSNSVNRKLIKGQKVAIKNDIN
jgi:uncharacterized protein YegL